MMERLVAFKVTIADILSARPLGEDRFLIADTEVSRINLIATVISQEHAPLETLLLDDGTGQIQARSFDTVRDITPGSLVLIIGRLRSYGAERYVIIEILNGQILPGWTVVRRKENPRTMGHQAPVIEEKPEVVQPEEVPDQARELLQRITALDDGQGVPLDMILAECPERLVRQLMQQGDIFEVRPGFIKRLE